MLILTKEEINEKIECFKKLIGIYNTKIEFLQKLLLYFEKNGQTVDCIVLNICVKGVAEEIFACDDEIQIHHQNMNINEYISNPLLRSNDFHNSLIKNDSSICDASNSISSNSVKCNEISHNYCDKISNTSNTLLTNTVPETVSPLQEQVKDQLSKSLYPTYSAFSNSNHSLMMIPKSESTTTDIINDIRNVNSHSTIISQKIKSGVINTESRRQNPVKIKKSTSQENQDQLNNNNIFLSNTAIDDIDQIHSTIKSNEPPDSKVTNSKSVKLKQFKCEFCSSAFAQKGVLNRHKFLRHSPTVVKPHICPKCQKGFTLKHHLKNHLKCKSGCRFFS